MTAAFLPSILVPIVGIIFPAFSMALFFLYFKQMILLKQSFLILNIKTNKLIFRFFSKLIKLKFLYLILIFS